MSLIPALYTAYHPSQSILQALNQCVIQGRCNGIWYIFIELKICNTLVEDLLIKNILKVQESSFIIFIFSWSAHRYPFARAAITKCHSSGDRKSKIKVSELVGFFWDHSPWLVDGRLLPESSHGLPFVCPCVLISTCKDTTHPLPPYPRPHFNL